MLFLQNSEDTFCFTNYACISPISCLNIFIFNKIALSDKHLAICFLLNKSIPKISSPKTYPLIRLINEILCSNQYLLLELRLDFVLSFELNVRIHI